MCPVWASLQAAENGDEVGTAAVRSSSRLASSKAELAMLVHDSLRQARLFGS